jgi:hypothetical protein
MLSSLMLQLNCARVDDAAADAAADAAVAAAANAVAVLIDGLLLLC